MSDSVSARDTSLAAVLGVGACAVFALTLQARLMGDGCWIVEHLLAPHHARIPTHPLFWFVQWGLAAVAPDVALETLAWGTSAVAGGLAASLVFLAARGLGAPRTGAAGASLLLVLSPAGWFFATTIEYHALTMAAAAGVTATAALAPWGSRRGLALGMTAVAFAPAFLSHQVAALLGPGMVALVAWLAARGGRPYTRLGVLLGVGPLLLGALLVPQLLVELRNGGHGFGGREGAILTAYSGRFEPLTMIWSAWALRLAVLLPVAALGFFALRAQRGLAAALGLGVALPWLVFVTVYPVPERGGFFLASGVLWAAAAAFARLPAAGWGVAVALQAALGFHTVRSFDGAFDPRERAEQVRSALPEGGVLAAIEDLAPRIELYVPAVTEFDLVPLLRRAREVGLTPEAFADGISAEWSTKIETTPLALDLSYRFWVDRSDVALDQTSETIRELHEPYTDALEARLYERFRTERIDHPSWPLLVLAPR